jgi:alpha-glucosidase
VLSNHDVVRHTTRLSLGQESPQGDGVGPLTPGLPAAAPALRRARAATALMLALPGGAYIYQGEELGLPEATDLPDDARQDPTWFRTNGERYGRDGCRVPLPWSSGGETFGFSSGGQSWLPQPSDWGALSREAQEGVPGSTLELYTSLLRLRREHALAHTDLVWLEDLESGLIGFRVGDVTVVANTSGGALPMPATGEVLVASDASFDAEAAVLPGDTTVWMRAENNTTL